MVWKSVKLWWKLRRVTGSSHAPLFDLISSHQYLKLKTEIHPQRSSGFQEVLSLKKQSRGAFATDFRSLLRKNAP